MQHKPNIKTTVDAQTLLSMELEPPAFVVDRLITPGVHLLAGAPKIGKSWMVLHLCLQVAKGEPVWGFETRQGTVLYLCLEDTLNRIQNRLLGFGDDAPDALHFCTEAERIGGALEQRIEAFVTDHPDTALIAIDTLQQVRGSGQDSNIYAKDYQDIQVFKKLADQYGAAILLVHHLRKQGDSDPFNRVSGTTGLTGAVDSSFVLEKDKRASSRAKLCATGRDIEYQELTLEFDPAKHQWEMIEYTGQDDRGIHDEDVLRVVDLIHKNGNFHGTAPELLELFRENGGRNICVNILAQRISFYKRKLLNYGIHFERPQRSSGKRPMSLTVIDQSNDNMTLMTAINGPLKQPSQLSCCHREEASNG